MQRGTAARMAGGLMALFVLPVAAGGSVTPPPTFAMVATTVDTSGGIAHAASAPVCLPHDGNPAATLQQAFATGNTASLGALSGFDEPTIYPLGDGRQLWLVHDAYLDLDHSGGPYQDQTYVHNVAMEVTTDAADVCVSLRFQWRPDGLTPVDFETGPTDDPEHHYKTMVRWWWALGGGIDADGTLTVLWAEMEEDHGGRTERRPQDGITRHPVAVWRAVYDPVTLDRLAFEPAADPGIAPLYGVGVVDDPAAGFTYLFGNAMERDLTRSGGYEAGPHPGTRTYLARVPLGQYTSAPEYWDGGGWSTDRTKAAAVHEGGWAEWMLQPRLIDGQWVSITKVDAFWSAHVVVQTADHPQGPWAIALDIPFAVPTLGLDPTSPGGIGTLQATYSPVIVPDWSRADRLTVVMSQNGWNWPQVCDKAAVIPYYWPAVVPVDLDQ